MKNRFRSSLSFSEEKRTPFDLTFFILAIVLAVFGSITVFSAGSAYAEFRYSDSAFFIKRQILWLVLGACAMIGASYIPPAFYKKATPYAYGATLFLLILVLVIGFVGNGAQRWISLGPITIQPSEIAKMTMVMALALYFSEAEEKALDRKNRKNSLIYGTLIPLLIIAVPILLVMLQKHLSCIIILGVLSLCIIVISGAELRYIGAATALGALGVSYLALFTDYTKDRITVWLDPEAYKLTGGWQTLQGLMAIGSGGLFGKGWGNGELKLCYVSEPANDMIFSIICEELGFVGAIAVLFTFALLIYRGFRIAKRCEDCYSRLLAYGIMTKIAIQLLLNIAVVTNTIPNTGISLPFFSYGGSSLIMILLEMGIMLSISKRESVI